LDLDGLTELIRDVRIVRFKKEDWTTSSCTCSYFLKNYFCYHLIVLAVVEYLVEIPNNCKNVSIEPKSKRGRKANAAKALVTQ
jgi:hypothetical protein